MRRKAGPRFALISLFTVFWLQAGVLWVVSLPLQAAFAPRRLRSGRSISRAAGDRARGACHARGLADHQLTSFGRDRANSAEC